MEFANDYGEKRGSQDELARNGTVRQEPSVRCRTRQMTERACFSMGGAKVVPAQERTYLKRGTKLVAGGHRSRRIHGFGKAASHWAERERRNIAFRDDRKVGSFTREFLPAVKL